jgi:ABC-type Fe3+-hydroxamate transport system substrate-binding protein
VRVFIVLLLGLVCSPAIAKQPTVASLVPAATDLIVSMGAGDHLVGVSNYDDTTRPELKHLPKIGDYQTIDWERLSSLKPNILILFHSPERIPPGVKERAQKLNIQIINVRPESLDDLYAELKSLGKLLNEEEKSTAAAKKLQTHLAAIQARVKDKPRIRTLVIRDETATATVGRGKFLSEILELAGGTNVIEESGWPTIDRERLTALNPDAIIQLLSAAPPQVEKQAAALWQRMPHLSAVKNNRIKIINVWYSQQPGLHIADLADQFATFLHPDAAASEPNTSSKPPKAALTNQISPRGVAGGAKPPMHLRHVNFPQIHLLIPILIPSPQRLHQD